MLIHVTDFKFWHDLGKLGKKYWQIRLKYDNVPISRPKLLKNLTYCFISWILSHKEDISLSLAYLRLLFSCATIVTFYYLVGARQNKIIFLHIFRYLDTEYNLNWKIGLLYWQSLIVSSKINLQFSKVACFIISEQQRANELYRNIACLNCLLNSQAA